MQLRGPVPEDRHSLLAVAEASGLFAPGEVEQLLGDALTRLHAGTLGAGHAMRVAVDDASGGVLGWSYTAPADAAEGDCAQAHPRSDERELLWLGVAPAARRAGVATCLLADAERAARDVGALSLRIRTSTQPEAEPARALYRKHGYAQRGEAAPDYYEPGVHMLEFIKTL